MKWFSSLRAKILISTFLLLTLSMGVAVFWIKEYQKRTLIEDSRKKTAQISEVVKRGLKYQMLKRDGDFTQETISDIQRGGYVTQIHVINKEGMIAKSSNPEKIGKVIPKTDAACRLCHTDSITPEAQTVVFRQGDQEFLRNVNPIENEPSCHKCHPPQNRLLGILLVDNTLQDTYLLLRSVETRLVVVGMLTLVVLLGVITVLGERFINQPVKKLVQGSKELEQGNLDVQISIDGDGELAALAHAFNNMAWGIKERIEEIKTKNFELSILYGIVERISKTIVLSELKSIILHLVIETLSADRVYLINPTSEEGTFSLSLKENEKEEEIFTIFKYEEGAPPPYDLPPDAFIPWLNGALDQDSLTPDGQLALLPLRLRDQRLGLIVAQRPPYMPFKESDLRLMSAVSTHVSVAFENARLYTLAITDELTGLYTLRFFQQKMIDEISRYQRYGQKTALLMLDLDRFKKINDNYGHPAGDKVLKGISALILKSVRSVDIAFRYGGEEFAVILPETDTQAAQVVAERIRQRIEEHEFSLNVEGKVKVTISIGLSACPKDANNIRDLVDYADQALYRAKETGRNKVCVYQK
jgi:diguanylate cyclase (GGDEF)-like protein